MYSIIDQYTGKENATCFSTKNVSEACDDKTKVLQSTMEVYIPHTYEDIYTQNETLNL